MPSRSVHKGQRRWRLDKLEVPGLEDIEPKARRKIMRKAVRIGALEARKTAPDSGRKHKNKLNKSIRYDVMDKGMTGRIKARAPHAHLVHDGTKAHAIPAPEDPLKRRRAFPLFAGGHSERHPGARANPFLVRAGEKMRPEMEQVLREGVNEALGEVIG
jgi:HK97 gp10 family phage protein